MLRRNRFVCAIPWIACIASSAASARADTAPCTLPIARTTVVSCALSSSLVLRAERLERDAIGGREIAASPWLPSNPVVSLSGSRRFGSTSAGLTTYNWSAALGQEIEIAGQRGARREVVDAQRGAQDSILNATSRDVAAIAWAAYFERIAAREDLALAVKLESLSKRVADAVAGATAKGIDSGIEADLADAAFVRASALRTSLSGHEARSAAALATVLGLDPMNDAGADGDLAPLPIAESLANTPPRLDPDALPSVMALTAQRRSLQRKADYYRRARWPNPTVSVVAQNDEIDQPVLGVGLAFPLVLPAPLGHTFAGEIVESDALAQKVEAQAEKARRDARLQLAGATHAYVAAREARALYTKARLTRADTSLQGIADAVASSRITVREALLSQQGLIELLRGDVESRLALCLASVELAHAAGVALERGAT